MKVVTRHPPPLTHFFFWRFARMQCQLNKWKLWPKMLLFKSQPHNGHCYIRHFQNFPIWHCISTCYLLSSRILASTLSDNHMHHLAASNACTALHTSIYTHPAFIFSCWWWSTSGDHPKKRFSDGNKLLGNSQNSRKSSGKTWLNNRNLPKSCELFFGVW